MTVIVTGMPFSGASVVAQALAEAGVYLGSPLGTGTSDLVGMFVNRELAAFHDGVLLANRTNWLSPESAIVRPEDAHRAQALELLQRQFGTRPLWGYVDPRATLLLEFWNTVLPASRWVFVIRRPAAAAWALLLRDPFELSAPRPSQRLAVALRLWLRYNELILRFARQEPARCAVLFAPDDFGPTGDARVNALTLESAASLVRPIDLGGAYHRLMMRTAAPRWVALQTRLYRAAGILERELDDLRAHQLKERGGSAPTWAGKVPPATTVGPAPRTVCVASRRRHALSETFVREQLRRLPATIRWLHGDQGQLKRDKDGLPIASSFERTLNAALEEFGVRGARLHDRSLRRYLRRERVDVVLGQFGPISVDCVEACAETGIPLVAHFHGYDAYRRSTLATYRLAYQRLFEVARVLIVVSRAMGRQLQSLGAPEEKIVLNPCGVDTDFFDGARPETAPPLLLSVGRFVEKKAPHHVLTAFSEVLAARPAARLLMVGDGVLLEPCRELVEALGIAHGVTFAGARPHTEVASYMRTARAFVQHSIRAPDGNAEGTPVSVMEASACGLPVVGSRHMGIEDVVRHGETGYLVEEGDTSTMARHMTELVDDPARAAELGRRGRALICSGYSIDRAIARLWEVLESAIESSRRSR